MCYRDPRAAPDAQLLHEVAAEDPRLDQLASDGGALGRGGMITKVRAARVAARSGADTLILGGRLERALVRAYEGEVLGTFLSVGKQPQATRKRCISAQLQTRANPILNDGAVSVL